MDTEEAINRGRSCLRPGPLRVAIIGGGIGGLTLAQGLRKYGITPQVFERAKARTDYVQGFRLGIRERGLQALAYCLPETLYAAVIDTAGRSPVDMLRLDEHLQPIAQGADMRLAYGDVHRKISLSRITLRQVLLDGLDGVVRYGAVFSQYDENPDGSLTVHFEDGRRVTCDVLVGADGSASRVRKQFLPSVVSYDTGVRRLAGKIAFDAALRRDIPPLFSEYAVSIKPANGHSLMITSHQVNPGSYARYGLIGTDDVTHKSIDGFHFNNTTSYIWWNTAHWQGELASDEELMSSPPNRLLDLLTSRLHGHHPDILRLIHQTDPSTVAALRVRSSEPAAPWATRNITLLGDAIHAMTYFCALGGNSAMFDSGQLTRAIVAVDRGETSLVEGLRRYETAMQAHGFEAVRNSLTSMYAALGPRPVETA
jgi:2-polyprenyl-6-methoxyphenol hydroxylase-like FAD-dependent oxidoreductase